MGWAAAPQVALGYVLFAAVCLAYAKLPGAEDAVEVDESDVMAH